MKRLLTLLFLFILKTPLFAQYSEFPVYDDFSLPNPGKSTLLKRDNLKPTDAFLHLYPDGIPAADNATLHKIYRFYRDTQDGQKEWNGIAGLTARVVSEWRLKGSSGFSAERMLLQSLF